MDTRGERAAFILNAVVAWSGVLIALAFAGWEIFEYPPPDLGELGGNPSGPSGSLGRMWDELTYFTIWSNIVVAVATTLRAIDPRHNTLWRRAIRVDSVVMITITAVLYAVLLAPIDPMLGWAKLTTAWLHVLTPILTIVVWVRWGPRGSFSVRSWLLSLAIPIAWVVVILVRGAMIGAYPYPFLNVVAVGYPRVLTTILVILAISAAVTAAFGWLDRQLSRTGSR